MFEDEWKGKLQDKDTQFYFAIGFSENNKEVEVKYRSNGVASNVNLELKFQLIKVTREGIKLSIFLQQGEGTYQILNNKTGKETIKKFTNLEFIFFIVGPRCVFGIEMPPVLLHDLRLQRRTLANRHAIANQLE